MFIPLVQRITSYTWLRDILSPLHSLTPRHLLKFFAPVEWLHRPVINISVSPPPTHRIVWLQSLSFLPAVRASVCACVPGITNTISWQEGRAIAKMTAQCALYIRGCPKIFGTPWLHPRLLFPTFSWAFVSIDPMNNPTKFEVRSFTRSWDNRGVPKNLGIPWIRPRSPFSKSFNGLLFGLAL